MTVIGLALVGGCFNGVAYDDQLLTPPTVFVARDASVDAYVETDAGPELRRPPERPDADTNTAERVSRNWGLLEMVVAPEIVGPEFARYGYDLDGVITNSLDTASCIGGAVVSDGELGEDNVFAKHLMTSVGEALSRYDVQSSARTSLRAGNKVPMIHLEGWNGKADDALVTVWAAVSADFSSTAGDAPVWDGTDVFYPRDESFVEGDLDQPLAVDTAAYVAGNVLVANINDATFQFAWFEGLPEIGVLIRDLTITGTIEEDGTLSDVIFAGRWRTADVLQAFAAAGFCQGTLDYNAIVLVGEQFADVRADSRSDNMGATCDAVSLGVGFTGEPLELGSESHDSGQPTPSPCE